MLMPLVTTRLTGPPTVVGASNSQPPHTARRAASVSAMPRLTDHFTLAYRPGMPDPKCASRSGSGHSGRRIDADPRNRLGGESGLDDRHVVRGRGFRALSEAATAVVAGHGGRAGGEGADCASGEVVAVEGALHR